MKKLVLLLSFVFVLGLVSVNASDLKVATKTPVKTEQTAKKKGAKSKKGKNGKKKSTSTGAISKKVK